VEKEEEEEEEYYYGVIVADLMPITVPRRGYKPSVSKDDGKRYLPP
jgi:hypothetical protein